jgi:hypothetical protein
VGIGGGAGAGTGGAAAAGLGGAAGGAGGGWLPLGGSLAIKLAAGCLLFAGLGGGCAALVVGVHHSAHTTSHHQTAPRADAALSAGAALPAGAAFGLGGAPGITAFSGESRLTANGAKHTAHARRDAASSRAQRPIDATAATRGSASAQAQRELGFERLPALAATPNGARLARVARTIPSPSPPSAAAQVRSGTPRGALGEFEVQ